MPKLACRSALPGSCRTRWGWLAVVGVLLLANSAQLSASDRQTPTVRAYARVKDAVVNIHGQKTISAADEPTAHGDSQRRVNGMGTGVLIDQRGYILTNYHVVEGVAKIEVTLANGKSFVAQSVSTDPTADLAVIKISGEKFPVIPIGTSNDLMIGETVIAVGNAYGYENTVTQGIISALHRSVQVNDAQGYEDLIQTSAEINPGNSGGPLVNIDGDVIGVNVAVRAGAQAIGFAIPIDKAMAVAARLMSVERIDSHWHGIAADDAAAATDGVAIGSVEKDSPAAKIDLRPGDVITAVDGQDVARALDFERALLGRKTGEEIPLTVRRNGESLKMSLALAGLPNRPAAEPDLAWDVLGLKLAPIAAPQFKQYQSRYHGGLSITEVRAESPAAKQGLRRGDVLVGMHIWETVSMDNVNYILNRNDLSDIDPMKFYILRGSETLYGHFNVSMQKKASARE